jgi:hypothetical protein
MNMINDHELTKELLEDAKKADGIIHNSLFKVMNNRPQEEFEKYRKAIGKVIWGIYENIISPLTKDFPELNPLNQMEKKEVKSREEDIPSYDADAPPFLERLYHIHYDDGKKVGMTINFHKPAKSKDADDWYCTFQIASELSFERKKAFGVDAIQAFQNAVKNVDTLLREMVKGNKITWVGGEDISIIL